jgi:uncharacterized protein YeaO (DUF488 family)
MDIRVKRAYRAARRSDGVRILVDRLWPRGLSKDRFRLDQWAKDLAPSTELRHWFNHDPARWDEFRQRYAVELDSQQQAVKALLACAIEGPVTLLYAAKDEELNNAVALKAYLENHAMRGKP